ncbi:MAG: hypothetical protein NDI94_04500 [Candidatus Woesearchaeota archaeon]|nr:hypothetical protein [Candidatus Woesearchaeota archaeon]
MRKVSRVRYLVAAAITIGIFLFGLFLGLVVENKRIEYVQKNDKVHQLEYSSLQLLYTYVDQLSQAKECDAIPKIYDLSLKHLETTRIRLESYEKDSKINDKEFELLRREYVQAELRYWLLAQRIKKMCNLDIATMLYFYSTDKECPECSEQAFILTYLKDIFGQDLLIFALDSNYEEEPLIPMIKRAYNVEEYPTIVLGGKVFSGFTTKDELRKELCDTYRNASICDHI